VKPVNREELLQRIDHLVEVPGEPPVRQGLRTTLKRIIEVAEWFDFGTLEADACIRAARDARPFRQAGLLRPPYNLCVMRMRLDQVFVDMDGKAPESGDALLVVEGATAETAATLSYQAGKPIAADHDVLVHVLMSAADGFTQYLDTILIKGVLPDSFPEIPEGEGDHPIETDLLYDALWLILNTKNIRKRVDVPSPRLNKARAKLGRPPLRQVTRIDAAQYMRALEETERMECGGHHASPRMHLRRAHLRYLTDERYSEEVRARPIMISATIVNIDSDSVAVRERYEVKT
jgi:hypothetical protein